MSQCPPTVFLAALFFAGDANAQKKCDGLLFASGFDGAPTHGTKDALVHAVNNGERIRVGWELDFDRDGEADLSHWADAVFLSVRAGEVFAQVDAVHSQTPKRGSREMRLREPYTEWRGLLGTNGKLEGRYSNKDVFPDDLRSRMTWCSARGGNRRWAFLYRNGLNGEDLAGSKQALLAAIRSGQPIQVAWGGRFERNGRTISVEHLAAPVFVTITNGEDVAAQLPEHIAQRHYADIDQAFFDDPAIVWRGLMTTKGTFDAAFVNRGSGKTVRRYPQRAVLSWFAPASPDLSAPSLALKGGVTLDKSRSRERIPGR